MAKRKSPWKSCQWMLLLLSAFTLATLWFVLHTELLKDPGQVQVTHDPEGEKWEGNREEPAIDDAPSKDATVAPSVDVTSEPAKDYALRYGPPVAPAPAPVKATQQGAKEAPTLQEIPSATGKNQESSGILTVALAAELKQLDGALVVLNSATKNAADPSKLHFRILTTEDDASELLEKVKDRLKQPLNVEAVNFEPWYPRVGKLLGGKSSARKELFDALNFAAFYLHEAIPEAPGGRVLYLDTDVVVKSDLSELLSVNFRGHPAAAAEDCSQRMGKYLDVDRLKSKALQSELPPALHASKKGCVINRGVVLVDLKAWKAQNITGVIEDLVRLHLTKGKGPLWRAGVSQPPFLIALAGKFVDLGAEFNVRGLGRGDIAPEEVDFYKKKKMWDPYFDKFLYKCKFHCCPGCKGWALSPYISAPAQKAKILHFNGRLKPSHSKRRDLKKVTPPKQDMSEEERAAREQRPLCSCGSQCVQECAGIWWEYLPP
ncbi:unnamed protein product [Cladocopium goreaui]|uniref:Glycosyltransferase 8 domain-containing protein 1 n=1 Tax=Cladocopium goreaui TaxID=2562237 RepID=A0A9P1CQ38_9DINO|nr:unnamed protein product [Cladocopium goreaui]